MCVVCVYVYVLSTLRCMHKYIYVYVYVYVLVYYVCLVAWLHHYGPDTQAIRRPTHGMISRFVPVRAVKTRRRFESKIASFHVSACSYVFLYLLLPIDVSGSVRIISCDCMIYLPI